MMKAFAHKPRRQTDFLILRGRLGAAHHTNHVQLVCGSPGCRVEGYITNVPADAPTEFVRRKARQKNWELGPDHHRERDRCPLCVRGSHPRQERRQEVTKNHLAQLAAAFSKNPEPRQPPMKTSTEALVDKYFPSNKEQEPAMKDSTMRVPTAPKPEMSPTAQNPNALKPSTGYPAFGYTVSPIPSTPAPRSEDLSELTQAVTQLNLDSTTALVGITEALAPIGQIVPALMEATKTITDLIAVMTSRNELLSQAMMVHSDETIAPTTQEQHEVEQGPIEHDEEDIDINIQGDGGTVLQGDGHPIRTSEDLNAALDKLNHHAELFPSPSQDGILSRKDLTISLQRSGAGDVVNIRMARALWEQAGFLPDSRVEIGMWREDQLCIYQSHTQHRARSNTSPYRVNTNSVNVKTRHLPDHITKWQWRLESSGNPTNPILVFRKA
jgi:hypothetical protein